MDPASPRNKGWIEKGGGGGGECPPGSKVPYWQPSGKAASDSRSE